MAKRAQYQWVYSPRKPKPPKIPAALKAEVTEKGNALVEEYLKPTHIRPVPEDHQWNYLSHIFTKWWGSYFYFCGEYTCPGPNALAPSFETKFARLTYTGDNQFLLSAMRHNGEWIDILHDQTLDEALEAIKEDPWFHP